jgi:excisionase family DNA binding protein
MPINGDKYIELPLKTVGDTARHMGVGRKIVYQLIEYGEIRAVKNKSRVEIEKASVDAFRAAGRLT